MIWFFLLGVLFLMIPEFIGNKKGGGGGAFESGFDPHPLTLLTFSMHFFVILIIFLIFDVEVILILPFLLGSSLTNPSWFFMCVSWFFMFVFFSTLLEWVGGYLDWMS